MKKLLILILIALLLALAFIIAINGVSMGKFEILGIRGIQSKSIELDEKIQEAGKIAQTMENVYVCNMLYDMDEWESLMHFLSVTCQKLDIIRAQKEDLMKKIDEIRLVDRAKCLLIEKFHYSEEKAHYTIEKKAMDNRLSRLQVAQIIIRHIEKEE